MSNRGANERYRSHRSEGHCTHDNRIAEQRKRKRKRGEVTQRHPEVGAEFAAKKYGGIWKTTRESLDNQRCFIAFTNPLDMGVFYETIPDTLRAWILEQKVFWVATAPLSGSAHVNVSPKGGKYFGIIDERTFWYMDLTGSGNETLAHLHEPGNGRITVMFNAFEGAPKIVRLWGKGRVLEAGTQPFETFIQEHKVKTLPGTRSIIIVDVHQAGSSCGFSVPFYDFKDFRPTLNDHFEKLTTKHKRTGEVKDSIDHYWAYKNSWSIDGLPGMNRAQVMRKKYNVTPLKKMVGPFAPTRYQSGFGVPLQLVIMIALIAFCIGLAVAMYAPLLADRLGHGSKFTIGDVTVGNSTHLPSLGRISMALGGLGQNKR